MAKAAKPCPSGYIALRRGCGHNQAVVIGCKSPLCASCERRRARRLQKRWTATLKTLPELKLLTLTIESDKDLRGRLDTLDSSFRQLLDIRIGRNNRNKIRWLVAARIEELVASAKITAEQSAAWQASTDKWLSLVKKAETQKGKSFKLRKLIKGLSSLEVTYSERDGWHAHRHLIVSTPYMPQIVLNELWKLATKGKGHIVDIRAIKDVESGVTEALKYVTKGWEIPRESSQPDQVAPSDELLECLRGKKRVWVLGRIKPKAKEETPCVSCNSTECTCKRFAVVSEQVHKLDDGSGYLVEQHNAPPMRLVITRDDKNRRTWRIESIPESVLSLYRTRYQEKEAALRDGNPFKRRRSKKSGDLRVVGQKEPATQANNSSKPKSTEGAAQLAL